jgi:beta-galactosidase
MDYTHSISRRSLLEQVGAAGLVSVLGSTEAARAETAPTRIRDSFDFDWRFLKEDAPGAQQSAFADASWRNVDLPHDWSIEGPYGEKEATGGPGGYLPTGIGWYRKHFRLSESYSARQISLEFDGVYENSEVWVNGHYLGKRPFGYIGFSYDLTAWLNFGARENVVAVRVDNSHQPNSRWYSGSGIYRHTWLVVTGKVHVAQWGTYIAAPQITADFALVRVRTKVVNDGEAGSNCILATTIADRDGKEAQTAEAKVDLASHSGYEFVQQFNLRDPHLWSLENPYLYTVRSVVREQDRVLDEYQTVTGIRHAAFDSERGFLLNGQRVKMNGACLHHEAGSVGAAVPERVWERRLTSLKEMGCNAIRTSHNPPAPEFLDLCDRMGFLVMDEFVDEWKVSKPAVRFAYSRHFDEWAERDATDMIHRDRNHPSVVLWSAGNEVHEQWGDALIVKRLVDLFHKEDPTRAVTVACHRIGGDPSATLPEFLDALDVVGYNYADRFLDRKEKYYSIDKLTYPRRKFIGTESTGMGRGLSLDAEQLWKYVRTYDYVSGDFMWTGIDYLGEAGGWPAKGSSSGVLDTCGFTKDGYYFYQSQWTAKPMLHLFPHWNWKAREGQIIPVMCFTNCDTVELFLNGKSFGVKGYAFPRVGLDPKTSAPSERTKFPITTSDLHLSWDVPYEPGTLKAVGTENGKVVATIEVATTGDPAAIELSLDRESIAADRRDVAHLTVHIVDAAGRTVPLAENELTFALQGEGRIIGVDNGNPLSHEDYKSNRRKAYKGACLAIVQSTGTAGPIRLEATSPGLKSQSVGITTKKG